MDDTWRNDPNNPQNWPTLKRVLHTLVISWIAFTCTLALSIYAPAHHEIILSFNTSRSVASLPLSLYVLGLGFGPAISAPSSETFGRRAVYLACMPVFALFTLGAGFSNGIVNLCVCRLFAGIFAAPGLSIGSGMIADLWAVHERATPMALYVACPLLGPAIGPLVGSFAVQERSWRWTQWIVLFACVPVILGAFIMNETYKKIILKKAHKKNSIRISNAESGEERAHELPVQEKGAWAIAARSWIKSTLTRPLHMLATEPIILFTGVYVALTFGIMYVFYTVTPFVFATSLGFDLERQGLAYIGMAIAVLLAFGLIVFWAQYMYRPQVAVWKRNEETKTLPQPPEWRLLPALVASPILPAALFLFGWTSQYKLHWIAPIVGMSLFAAGTYLVFLSTMMYLTDCYGPLYGASAMAGNTMLRYFLGATFPLFTLQMFSGLGIGWASSLLAFVCVVLGLCPWLLLRYGPKLRKRQKYANSN